MLQFNPFEIRRNIEEKRIFYGKKLEEFLLKRISKITQFFAKNIEAKSSAFFGSILIFALSVFIRSRRDIGYESAAFLQGLNQDASPLFLQIINSINQIANFANIHVVIIAEIFSNLVGILMLFFCGKILLKSDLAKNRAVYNLTIIAFAFGFFLRVFTLHFNEFSTDSTYSLALIFLFFSYQLVLEKRLQKSDYFFIAIISALLVCLDVYYLSIIAVFEIFYLLKNRNLPKFLARNSLVLLCLLLNFGFYHQKNFHAEIFYQLFKFDIFWLISLMFLSLPLLKKKYLQPFFLLNIATIFLLFLQQSLNYDDRFIIYSLASPSIFLLSYEIIKDKKINWKNDWVILFLILFLPVFALKTFSELFFDLVIFWWIFVLVENFFWRKNKATNHDFLAQFFLLKNFNSWLCFSALAAITLRISLIGNLQFFAWVFSAIIFLIFLHFNQNFFVKKEFPKLNARVIVFLFSYFLALHFDAIFGFKNFEARNLKSPNFINDEVANIIKTFAKNDEKVTFISKEISAFSPLFVYLGKDNNITNLKARLEDKKNKLIFVEDEKCKIGFIEESLRDSDFKKIFHQNYIFLTRIYQTKEMPKNPHFFADKELEIYERNLGQSLDAIDRDIDVYVRINSNYVSENTK